MQEKELFYTVLPLTKIVNYCHKKVLHTPLAACSINSLTNVAFCKREKK